MFNQNGGTSPFFSQDCEFRKYSNLIKRSFFMVVFVSHSHMISTFQPILDIASKFFLSRFTVALIFSFQKSVFVFGQLKWLQQCLCQKHPCMKIAFLLPGKTMSGFPGNPLQCNRYRYPSFHRSFLIIFSGFVSLDLTCRMLKLRCCGVC